MKNSFAVKQFKLASPPPPPSLTSPQLTQAKLHVEQQTSILRARLHEPGLAANPGQVASPGPPFTVKRLYSYELALRVKARYIDYSR